MTSADLRRIVEAMTARPWRMAYENYPDGCGSTSVLSSTDSTVYRSENPSNAARNNANSIATLANHADALVALVEACEAVARDWPGNCGPSLGEMKRVLSGVHAVRSEP